MKPEFGNPEHMSLVQKSISLSDDKVEKTPNGLYSSRIISFQCICGHSVTISSELGNEIKFLKFNNISCSECLRTFRLQRKEVIPI